MAFGIHFKGQSIGNFSTLLEIDFKPVFARFSETWQIDCARVDQAVAPELPSLASITAMRTIPQAASIPPFGQVVRQARLHKGWTVQEAASRFGCTSTQWHNYESGRSLPSIERLDQFCDLLGLEPLKTFRSWIGRKLKKMDSERLRNLLCRLETRPISRALIAASPATQHLLYEAGQFRMDDATARTAYGLIKQLVEYRSSLVRWPSQQDGPEIFAVPSNLNDMRWSLMPRQKALMQKVIKRHRAGVGFIATLVRIPSGYGGYHKDANNPDAGIEFFSVLRGRGYGYFESGSAPQWAAYPLRPQVVGLHRSDCGHVFVNNARSPLLLYIVNIPCPASMHEAEQDSPAESGGTGAGFEFRLADMEHCRLPASLKEQIRTHTPIRQERTTGRTYNKTPPSEIR